MEDVGKKFNQVLHWMSISSSMAKDIFFNYEVRRENNNKELASIRDRLLKNQERNNNVLRSVAELRFAIAREKESFDTCDTQIGRNNLETKNVWDAGKQDYDLKIDCQKRLFEFEQKVKANARILTAGVAQLAAGRKRNQESLCRKEEILELTEQAKENYKRCAEQIGKNNEETKAASTEAKKHHEEKVYCERKFAEYKSDAQEDWKEWKEDIELKTKQIAECENFLAHGIKDWRILQSIMDVYSKVADKKEASKLKKLVNSLSLDAHVDKCTTSRSNSKVGEWLKEYPELKELYDFLGESGPAWVDPSTQSATFATLNPVDQALLTRRRDFCTAIFQQIGAAKATYAKSRMTPEEIAAEKKAKAKVDAEYEAKAEAEAKAHAT